jgi:hypothetical protein
VHRGGERNKVFQKCPKCNAALDPGDSGSSERCSACGLVFAKYLQAQQGKAAPAPASAMDVGNAEIMGSFMHLIVLPIHEAGHLLFIPFGRFMSVLGGSLLQVLLPLVLMASFVFGFGGSRRDNFAASLMLWWAAVSIIDVAPYIWDAFDPKMMLLGGKTGAESDGHDWQKILGDLGLIKKAHLIAGIAHNLGLVMMLVAYAWGAVLLYLQFHRRDSDAIEDG